MMIFYLKSRNHIFYAEGIYNPDNNHLTVLEGAQISPTSTLVLGSGRNKWLKTKSKYVKDGYLTQDLEFKTPSTAATFVSGTSMNGYIRWKTKDGMAIRNFLYQHCTNIQRENLTYERLTKRR